MSYQEALERSIETFTAISDATSEADDLATELIHIQATRAATEARNELQQLLDQRLDLNLKSRDSETAVRVGVLGRLLTQLQSSLNYILWALRSGPGVKGKPPASIVASAAAEVLALAPGSLEVAMRRSDLQVTDDFARSVEVLIRLIEAADADLLGDDAGATEIVGEIGPEAARRLRRFFNGLAEADIDTDLEWRALQTARKARLSSENAKLLSDWLARANPTHQVIQVRGLLRMADSERGRFMIESFATGEHFEGKAADPGMLTHAVIDQEYIATLSSVELRSQILEDVRTHHTLVDLQPA